MTALGSNAHIFAQPHRRQDLRWCFETALGCGPVATVMKKVLAVAAVLAGLGVLARRSGPKMGNIDWAKRFEAMPDNAPPKWLFRNITAIRENTDRILELLEPGRAGPAPQPPPPDR